MAMAVAGIAAVSCVEVANVVFIFIRLKLTCELELGRGPCTKPVPFTVRVNPGSPAVFTVGEILVTANGGRGGTILNGRVLEIPPPNAPFEGVVTEMLADPTVEISPPGTKPAITVEFPYDVTSGVPLKFMTELLTKLEPNTSMVRLIRPAETLGGLREEMTGASALMGNSTDVESPPPGSGLNTNTTAAP
jgi:hypothetical protein